MSLDIYSYGLGFGAINDNGLALNDHTIESQYQSQIYQPSPLEKVVGSITGTNYDGTPKGFDLNKFIKLPEVVVKAENSQWWIIALIVGGCIVLYNTFFKSRK